MSTSFETCGNAIVLVYEDARPILATDPWLTGTCYFGSWGLELPLSDEQMSAVENAEYIWISHGHPDHLHADSLELLPRDKKILLPDSYHKGIESWLTDLGFKVETLKYRAWKRLSENVEICCIDNINQDAILVIRTSDGLVINQNDSPFFGELPFLRSIVRQFPREHTYLAALCAIDADMKNIVDRDGNRVIEPPEALKKGMIWNVARNADKLGVGSFCCSSSQHVYLRSDSAWANDYRITFDDIKKNWSKPGIRIIGPYHRIDLATGQVTSDPRAQTIKMPNAVGTGQDSWSDRLTEAEWEKVENYFKKFKTLQEVIDFVGVTVGGERRNIFLQEKPVSESLDGLRGPHFLVPKRSLLETVEHGYFDDLLIGNFMKTELINTTLYPDFTPLIAKYGDNAKVLNAEDLRAFRRHYMTRNRVAYLRWRAGQFFENAVLPRLRELAARLGVFDVLKFIYRRILLRDPV